MCPVAFKPVELPGRPPGLVVDIGQDKYEGALLEFTPGQTTDLITIFDAFTDGTLNNDLSNPVLAPSHVDATGTLEEL